MTTDRALLAAIWAAPHDDLPRLVYADWLDETGDPANIARAEFIRVQCELAQDNSVLERRGKLERRERDLWQRHRRDFRRELPVRLRDKPFHRGFVSPPLLVVTEHQLANLYQSILHAAPLWRFVVRAFRESSLSHFISDPLFLRLTELNVSGEGHAFRTLAADRRRLNLTDLVWAYSLARVQGVRWLTECGLPHLRTLGLASADIGDEGAKLLAESDLARQLSRLDLSSNEIGPRGVAAMSGRFPRLTDLDLSYSKCGDEAVAELVRGAADQSLRRLRLFGSELTTRTAELLASWPGAVSLEHLDLSGNVEIGRAGVVALTTSPYLTDLRLLRLSPADRDYAYIVDVLRQRFGYDGVTTELLRQGFVQGESRTGN